MTRGIYGRTPAAPGESRDTPAAPAGRPRSPGPVGVCSTSCRVRGRSLVAAAPAEEELLDHLDGLVDVLRVVLRECDGHPEPRRIQVCFKNSPKRREATNGEEIDGPIESLGAEDDATGPSGGRGARGGALEDVGHGPGGRGLLSQSWGQDDQARPGDRPGERPDHEEAEEEEEDAAQERGPRAQGDPALSEVDGAPGPPRAVRARRQGGRTELHARVRINSFSDILVLILHV